MSGANGATSTEMIAGAQMTPKALGRDTTRTFEPGSLEEAYRLAKVLVASHLLPRGVQTPEAAFAIIATGRELGLTAMQSLRTIHVIEGKPTLSADLICALVKQRTDVCKFFRLVETTDRIATYETHRIGEPTATRMSFTIEEAKVAGVTGKDNWRKYPAAMLRARAITALARAVYPDLATGIYDPDELDRTPVQGGPAEVVQIDRPAPRAPEPANSSAVDDSAFPRLAEAVDEAESASALNQIAKDAVREHKAGRLSDGSLASLKSAVKRKRDLVAGKAPPAPPPSGRQVQDADLTDADADTQAYADAVGGGQ